MTSFVAAVQDAERAQLIVDLKAARDALVSRGRRTGSLVGEDGTVCAKGAVGVCLDESFPQLFLAKAQRTNGNYEWAYTFSTLRFFAVERALCRHLPGAITIEAFNDDRATTDQDVLDLFDKALADLGGLA